MFTETLIGGIILFIVGVLETLFPDTVFYIQDFFRTDSFREPSAFYRTMIRIGGIFTAVAGAALAIAPFFLD